MADRIRQPHEKCTLVESIPPPQPPDPIASAILQTVIYADLFDYPLTATEVHRYLIGQKASLIEIEAYLSQFHRLGQLLACMPPFYFLRGRHHLVNIRRKREVYSQQLWATARRYGRIIAALPFVRMVGISGSLAMDNVLHSEDDIDLLIVTQRGRVWFARGLIILLVHLARQSGVELCPNYILAEHQLQLDEASLFTAHELAQMIPLSGQETYHNLLDSNSWIRDYLPNTSPRQITSGETNGLAQTSRRLAETIFGGRIGDALERWERERKVARLQGEAVERGSQGATFNECLCKGHMQDHGTLIDHRYQSQLERYGLA
jgi:hypothetical protein